MATTSERQPMTLPWRRAGISESELANLRAVLIALSIGVVLLFALGARRFYHQLLTPCPSGAQCNLWMRTDMAGVSPEFYARWSIGRDIVYVSVFCALAALLFWKAPYQPMALLGAITMIFFGAAVLPEELSVLQQSGSWLRIPAAMAEIVGVSLIVAFLLLFPDGRFVPRWTRWLLPPWMLLATTAVLSTPDDLLGDDGPLVDPLFVGMLLFCVGALVLRYRRATDPTERQQLKWVAYGSATAIVGLGIGAILLPMIPASVIANRPLFALVGITFTWSILLLIPFSLALALLRYRLWDVDRIARRAMLSGALIAVVTIIYAAIVLGASALIPGTSSRLWPLVAALIVALLLQPVRDRLERSINRLFYGQRDDPYAVISSLGERLEGSLSPETALPAIVDTIATELNLPYTAMTLNGAIAAEYGTPGNETIAFPLSSAGAPVGDLLVGPRSDGEPLGEADRRLLTDIARQAGAVADAMRLTRQLEQANRHLLSVRIEERQRLRRDLHDGLGPLLASQTLMLDSARKLMPSDPALADDVLDQLHRSIQLSVDDVRRLIDSLRPAALDELGLIAAIREGTADLQRAGLHISVEAPADLGAISAATETAAYRIVMEGVTNVVRHARASHCRVSLAVDGDDLRIEIADDGAGIAPQAPVGVGLNSMQERASELDGTLTVGARFGIGTTVVARLPRQVGAA